jgi:hypothetical protein
LRTRWTGLIAVAGTLAMAVGARAAESGLLGVKLFDSSLKIINLYGSPDTIEAINIGGMQSGGGGGMGAGGPAGGPMGPSGPMGGGGMGGGKGNAGAAFFGDVLLRQRGGPGPMGPGGPQGPMGPGGPMGGGGPQGRGMPPGVPPGVGMGGGGGGVPQSGGGSATAATYTRWIYNRGGSKYGFVVDKNGRCVQIEAIGLANPKVRTSKGITFGDTFAEVIKKYKTPDGYDIGGDNLVARFLATDRVAFRMARLEPGKPQVVTGIVVAAGKG